MKKRSPPHLEGKEKSVPAKRRAQAPKKGSQYERPTRNTEREEFPDKVPVAQWESFRKRPVEIRAMRFDVVTRPSPQGVCRCDDVPQGGQSHVHTLEGYHIVSDGDWIIQGVEGEFYPCKHGIFVKTYKHVPKTAKRSAERPARSRPKTSNKQVTPKTPTRGRKAA